MVLNVGFACSIPTTLRFIGKKTNYGCFVTVIALLRFGEAEESGLVQLDRVDRVAVLDPRQGLEKPKLFCNLRHWDHFGPLKQ